MPKTTMNGDRAFAYGALEAGVKVVTSYPGSPSSGTIDALVELTHEENVHIEWSTNEKVAFEMGIGASLAGRRALVCMKSVGMNCVVDPLMALNLTGVLAGMVVLLGDDPGAYGSQNDQDTRPIASFAEVPLLEPATPADAKSMMVEAFELSERIGTLVIVRETRSFSRQEGEVEFATAPYDQARLDMRREACRWVPYPANAVQMHAELHEKLNAVQSWANDSRWNVTHGEGQQGIIGVGFAHTKLLDVVGEQQGRFRILKLGTIYPPPDRILSEFLKECDEVLVAEENEPFVETQSKVIAYDHGLQTKVCGKLTGHISREGELFRWQIQSGLERFAEGFTPAQSYSSEGEADERPFRKNNCAACPFLEIVETLVDVGRELGQNPILTGDPGCLVRASHLLDAKYAMGGASALAQGMVRAGVNERVVAFFGDSAFFHTAIPALINSVYQKTPVFMVVLDNAATVTSGFQPNPGSGRDIRGRSVDRLSIEGIAAACGVDVVSTVGPDFSDNELREAFRQGLESIEIALLGVRQRCEPASEK